MRENWRAGVILHECSERRPSNKVCLFLFCTRIDSDETLIVQLSLHCPLFIPAAITSDYKNKGVFFPHSFSTWLNFQVCLKNKKFQTGRTEYLWYLLSSWDLWWNSYLTSNIPLCCFEKGPICWSFDPDKSQTTGPLGNVCNVHAEMCISWQECCWTP